MFQHDKEEKKNLLKNVYLEKEITQKELPYIKKKNHLKLSVEKRLKCRHIIEWLIKKLLYLLKIISPEKVLNVGGTLYRIANQYLINVNEVTF